MSELAEYPTEFVIHDFASQVATPWADRVQTSGPFPCDIFPYDEGYFIAAAQDNSVTAVTHVLECPADIDVRNDWSNAAGGVSYASPPLASITGDQVRVPNSSGTSYAVNFVVLKKRDRPPYDRYKRLFLIRGVAVWSAPISGRP